MTHIYFMMYKRDSESPRTYICTRGVFQVQIRQYFSSVYASMLDHLQSFGIVRTENHPEIESLVTKGILPGTNKDLYFLDVSFGFTFPPKQILARFLSTKKPFRFADIDGQSPSGKRVDIDFTPGTMFHSLHVELAGRCTSEWTAGSQKPAHRADLSQFGGESASRSVRGSFRSDGESTFQSARGSFRSGGESAAIETTFEKEFGHLFTGSPSLPSPPSNLKIVKKVRSGKIRHSIGILGVDYNGYLEFLMVQENNGEWGFPGGRRNPDESAFEAFQREYLEEVGKDVPYIDGTSFGTHEREPLKCVFHHARSNTNTAIYIGMADSNKVKRMIRKFQPKKHDPEILRVELVPVAHLQQMVEGEHPEMKMRHCAMKSTEAVLKHLKLWE